MAALDQERVFEAMRRYENAREQRAIKDEKYPAKATVKTARELELERLAAQDQREVYRVLCRSCDHLKALEKGEAPVSPLDLYTIRMKKIHAAKP